MHTFVLTFISGYAMVNFMTSKQIINKSLSLLAACESAKEDVMNVLDDVRKNVHETNLMRQAFQEEQKRVRVTYKKQE